MYIFRHVTSFKVNQPISKMAQLKYQEPLDLDLVSKCKLHVSIYQMLFVRKNRLVYIITIANNEHNQIWRNFAPLAKI